MSMDALTTAALASLQELMPKLARTLSSLSKTRGDHRAPDDQLRYLVKEALELLSLVDAWAHASDLAPTAPPTQSLPEGVVLSDEEALELLAIQDESAAKAAVRPTGPASSPAAPADQGQDEDLSDEEVQALLATMNDQEATPPPSSPPPTGDGGGEMSDEEARRLLEAMDAPPESQADAGEAGEMSEEEARRLLAEMDGSPPSAPQAAPAGEMSDEEARALLAAMDAPAEAPPPKNQPAAQAATLTADEEALAMLRSMGGLSDEEAQSLGAPQPARPPAAPAPSPEAQASDEQLAEIEEFSKNDFASDPDMMNDFLQNSDELMESLDQTILELERNPTNRETIESIFRAAHTLKGAAGMFGFKAIERVMHRMENLFDQVRKGTLVPNADTIDVVFQGLDVLRKLLGAVKNGAPSGLKTVPIVRALELAASGRYLKGSVADAGGGAHTAAPSTSTSTPPPRTPAQAGEDGGERHGQEGASGQKKAEQSTIRVDLERLDMLVNLVGELVIDRTRFATIEEEIRHTAPQIKVAGHMSETVQLFGRHMNEIHEIIMKIRMVPIGNAFNKFTRVVRDLARQLGKDINLHIEGEDTELDKTLVEQIGDPLIHLIRNSCDHGIETPEARLAQGKSRSGKIFLSARQEGNNIIITIEDDGKGIQVDAIRRKAIERGLIAEEAVLSKRDIFNLIFEPGFSTAEKVTTVSGRGVGMDVVRKQISKLKGLIDIDSEVGRGTVTTIRLPLTLAIVQSLLVETTGETFAIPLSTVIESVRIRPDEIQYVGDTEVIKRHGKVLPLMHLNDTLDLDGKSEHSWYGGRGQDDDPTKVLQAQRQARRKDRLYVVIVGSGERRFGIVVDQLLHQQEMVIKSMGPIMKRVACVAGGAVLGNGEVVLVLDIQELENHFRNKSRTPKAAVA